MRREGRGGLDFRDVVRGRVDDRIRGARVSHLLHLVLAEQRHLRGAREERREGFVQEVTAAERAEGGRGARDATRGRVHGPLELRHAGSLSLGFRAGAHRGRRGRATRARGATRRRVAFESDAARGRSSARAQSARAARADRPNFAFRGTTVCHLSVCWREARSGFLCVSNSKRERVAPLCV